MHAPRAVHCLCLVILKFKEIQYHPAIRDGTFLGCSPMGPAKVSPTKNPLYISHNDEKLAQL